MSPAAIKRWNKNLRANGFGTHMKIDARNVEGSLRLIRASMANARRELEADIKAHVAREEKVFELLFEE